MMQFSFLVTEKDGIEEIELKNQLEIPGGCELLNHEIIL